MKINGLRVCYFLLFKYPLDRLKMCRTDQYQYRLKCLSNNKQNTHNLLYTFSNVWFEAFKQKNY